MIPYFIILVLVLVFALLDRKSKNDFFKVFIFIILSLFSGLRFNVGIDYESYVSIFDEREGSFVHEPGSVLLFELLREIGATAQLYFLIMAIVTQLFVYKILIKNKNEFWLCVIVYYCVSLFYMASFNSVRNCAAITMTLWSLKYVENKEFLKFSLIILFITIAIHFSAFVFLPLYLIINKSFSKPVVLFFLLMLIIFNSLLWIVLSMTPYAKYDLSNNDTGDASSNFVKYIFLIISFSLFMFQKRFKNVNENTILCNMNILCFYTLILVVIQSSAHFAMLFQRFNNYFIYSYLLIIPALLSSMSKYRYNVSKIIIASISFAYFFRTIFLYGDKYVLVPYDYNLALFVF